MSVRAVGLTGCGVSDQKHPQLDLASAAAGAEQCAAEANPPEKSGSDASHADVYSGALCRKDHLGADRRGGQYQYQRVPSLL